MVAAYKVSALEYLLVGRRIVKRLPSVILTNLLLGENVVPEFLQHECTAEKLAAALAQAGRLTRPQLQRIASTTEAPLRRTHIAARHREGLRLIPIEEVMFFFAEQKYTTVRHAKGEDLIEDSLRSLEEEFGAALVRIHRNALVSVRYLEGIDRNAEGQYLVRLRGCPAPLQVSRRMASELRDRFRI